MKLGNVLSCAAKATASLKEAVNQDVFVSPDACMKFSAEARRAKPF
jgi:hypothetical protein